MSYSRITASLSEQDPFIAYLNQPAIKEKFLHNIHLYVYLPAKEKKISNFIFCLKDLSEIELFESIEPLLKNVEHISSQEEFFNWLHQVSIQALTNLFDQKGQLKEAIIEVIKTVAVESDKNWLALLASENIKIQFIRSYIEKLVGDPAYIKFTYNKNINSPLTNHLKRYLDHFFPMNGHSIIDGKFIKKHAHANFCVLLVPQDTLQKEIKENSFEQLLSPCPMM